MGKDTIKEDLEILRELIRTAYNHLDPVDKFSFLYHKKIMQKLYGKHPKCFLNLKRADGGPMGQPVMPYVLPVCNRSGIYDPDVIRVSMKMVKRLMDQEGAGRFDINDLQVTLDKLDRYHNRYAKEIPKPHNMAGRKANMSRMFNNIGKHLDKKV